MELVHIYALTCPDTQMVRYIGKANDALKRYKTHLSDARRSRRPVCCWVKSLLSVGAAPGMWILRTVAVGEWERHERELIAHYRKSGNAMLNLADGGADIPCSRAQRAANGAANARKRVSTPERKRLWELKHAMGQELRMLRKRADQTAYLRIVAKLKAVAVKRPDLFGDYLAL